jgi:DUF1680 family protein
MVPTAPVTDSALHPVPFTQVTLRDSFWAPRQAANRNATIPHVYEMCGRTGRVAAWEMTWKPGDPNQPHIFWDSDVAKWMEAASYSLATHPDSALAARLEALIANMARAQLPDGYLNSHYIAVEPDRRWSNLRDCHELYCAGHLIEAAVAHNRATGQTTMLDVLERYVNHVDAQFGREPGQRRGYSGHEEIELALVKLFRLTGEPRYLNLAQYFVEERGRQPHYFDIEARARGDDPARYYFKTYAHVQAHAPVREQTEAVGHAVRATYLYSAMADLARETGDVSLLQACERLWQHLTTRRLYVTGAIGSSSGNEGFTEDFDLPDETAYAETCAAIGLVFWSHRMLMLTGDRQYADVMERALYNGVTSSVSLGGRTFFYENPLASRGGHHRQEWYSCACCPPNIARLLASLGDYFYSTDPAGVWVHLYAQGEARCEAAGLEVVVDQETNYPWEGSVKLRLHPPSPAEFTLRLRVPAWCDEWTLEVNGERVTTTEQSGSRSFAWHAGYCHLHRTWMPGDEVRLNLAMPIRYVYANPRVRQSGGRVAVQRGPLIYCLEGADNPGLPLSWVKLPRLDPGAWAAEHLSNLLGGVTTLACDARVIDGESWGSGLYRHTPPAARTRQITAVPYCAWDNREPGEMLVWVRAEDYP